MNVYLVPTTGGRHELYCEAPARPSSAGSEAGGLWTRLLERFRGMVEEGESQGHGQSGESPRGGRLRRTVIRRIAEAVSEQRLLWHLRHETSARLLHPDDLSDAQSLSMARALLTADGAKHRRWCAIDAVIAAVTGPTLFFLPGPNLVAWYFAFRAVGHYFAMRGAAQGLARITWVSVPAHELTDLRTALSLDAAARARHIERIATALGLDRLPRFIEKVA